MLSKGHKIEYRCPHCNSINIEPITLWWQPCSGECFDCHTYWPWRNRIKESINNKILAVFNPNINIFK